MKSGDSDRPYRAQRFQTPTISNKILTQLDPVGNNGTTMQGEKTVRVREIFGTECKCAPSATELSLPTLSHDSEYA
jgi:hypothetical protein